MNTDSSSFGLDKFHNPPASHRSMPLWVWNGEMTEARITEMLEQFAAQGLGGVFVHPRPGLITEYLSERWFELWSFALQECKRLRLECNVYDENSFPAGFAGGHVPARIPYATAQYAEAVLHRHLPIRYEGELLGAFKVDPDGKTAIPLPEGTNLDDALNDGPVLTLALRRASGSPWTAWFPMVDITRPEVAREFIATTYEPYWERFGGEFGKTITSFFSDEPLIAASGTFSPTTGAPLSRYFIKEFRRDHGYDLQSKLADLFIDQEGAAATRFDYFLTLQRLWSTNFLKPIYEWCSAHNVRFTGHFMEHAWPHPSLSPSCMEGYRWMHLPGVDFLAPQFNFEHPEANAHYLMTLRELNSAANQLGRVRRLCETHGAGGYGATFEEFKRVSDWLMVHGVNFINQHLSYETICGARKYDYPQTFSDHSAWWQSYRFLADHTARLAVVLSQGEQRNRVLVLHSTTTGWLRCNPAREPLFGGVHSDAMDALKASEARLVQWLADHQVDFDFGDELLLAEFGRADGAQFHCGERGYSVVIVPEGMENWCAPTRQLLETYLDGGGVIIALREPPTMVNGRPSPWTLKENWQWRKAMSLDKLQAELNQLVPPHITMADGNHLPALVGHQMREYADGKRIHFLANTGLDTVRAEIRIAGAGVHKLDTLTGNRIPIAYRKEGQWLVIPLELASAGHEVWLVSMEKELPVTPPPAKEQSWRTMELEDFERIERMSPNVLGLDFCDLTVAGQTYRGLYVTRANQLCWQAHGFDQDVWGRAVQFRRNYFDFQFDEDSGFTAEFHFESGIAEPDIALALERPELYSIYINNHIVSFKEGKRWLDENILCVKIGHLLRPGTNTITLSAQPFHILCEIDRLYLLGDFALEPAVSGFRIVAPVPLKLGDWTCQGLAEYDGRVRYTASIKLDNSARGVIVETPKWAGSVIDVRLDGEVAGAIAFPPYRICLDRFLDAGIHELALEVVATPRNLLGPHFSGKGIWEGPGAWDIHPPRPAAGKDYRTKPYGLLAPVKLSLRYA